MSWRIVQGDAIERLRELPNESVQTCVTSPPYWALRDYGTAAWEGGDPTCEHEEDRHWSELQEQGPSSQQRRVPSPEFRVRCGRCGAERVDKQLGLEPTVEEYVANLVAVMAEVRRVLRPDGTVWLNLGDTYASKARGTDDYSACRLSNPGTQQKAQTAALRKTGERHRGKRSGLKNKDLIGVPWRVAFALQADGWWLRSEVIWAKLSCTPESVLDRPTRSHEAIFLLSKRERYFYDAAAIREDFADERMGRDGSVLESERNRGGRTDGFTKPNGIDPSANGGRNKRDVWSVATQPFPEAHFAVWPPKLIEPCILAGAPPTACGTCGAPWRPVREPTGRVIQQQNGPGSIRHHIEANGPHGATSSLTTGYSPEYADAGYEPTCEHNDDSGRATVLDPFAGSGTTGMVTERLGRDFIGIELNPEFVAMARERIIGDAPLLNIREEYQAEFPPAPPPPDGLLLFPPPSDES